MLDECVVWYRDGLLEESAAMDDEAGTFFEESVTVFDRFMSACLQRSDSSSWLTADEIYKSFQDWWEINEKGDPPAKNWVMRKMTAVGVHNESKRIAGKVTRIRVGIDYKE